MKSCFKCGQTKPLSDFYCHPRMADGHLNKCKTCAKQDVHDHRHGKGRERILAYENERAKKPERRENAKRIAARWLESHPKRRAAQVALGNAVRDKRIKPWPACAYVPCAVTKVQAHHPDYDRPLDVVWMCAAHHKQAHALFSNLI